MCILNTKMSHVPAAASTAASGSPPWPQSLQPHPTAARTMWRSWDITTSLRNLHPLASDATSLTPGTQRKSAQCAPGVARTDNRCRSRSAHVACTSSGATRSTVSRRQPRRAAWSGVAMCAQVSVSSFGFVGSRTVATKHRGVHRSPSRARAAPREPQGCERSANELPTTWRRVAEVAVSCFSERCVVGGMAANSV